MKKIMLIQVLLLSLIFLSAQNWCPAGAQWYYGVSYFQTGGYQYWHYDADTVIAGQPCKIVNGTQALSTYGIGDTTLTPQSRMYTYSSGDTVYMYDTAFYPVYYFNAHAGDTIYTRQVGFLNLSIVDSNGTTVINNDTLRYYVFHLLGPCSSDTTGFFKVIERIGCITTTTRGFRPGWDCGTTDPFYYGLCNYQDSAFAVYPDSTTNCTYLASSPPFVYHHLLDSINIWYYAEYVIGVSPAPNDGGDTRYLALCGDYSYRGVVYTQNDTLLLGNIYKILLVNNNNYFHGTYAGCLLGYIREDSVTGHVYFLDPDSTREYILYDFSMQVGQTQFLTFANNYGSGYQSGLYRLDSITNITIAAGVSRQYYLSCAGCNNGLNLVWVEGVGDLVDVLYPNSQNYYTFDFNSCPGIQHSFQQWVVCFDHAQKVYFDTCSYNHASAINGWTVSDSCDYSGGGGGITKLTSLSLFTTYPNPTNNKLTLQLNVAESAGFDIYIKDVEGKTVLNNIPLGRLNAGIHNAEIDLSALSGGFYLVECRTAAGSLYSKVIVQK